MMIPERCRVQPARRWLHRAGLFLQVVAAAWTALVCVSPAAPAQSNAPLTAAQEHGLKPRDRFRECAGCPEMVVVPAGSFTMGSPQNEKDRLDTEDPQHVVTIGHPFAAGRVHVTVDQFAAFVRETGYGASSTCWTSEGGQAGERAGRSWRNTGFAQEGSHPVVCVSWDDANAYAKWLARKTGKPYRLLSEAEWEYAARGKTAPGAYPRFWFGNAEKEICRYANSNTSACNDGYERTSPAGHYAPNAFGLYDMAGNAWQWTADCDHDSYKDAPAEGSAWMTGCQGTFRTVRGGSWSDGPADLRVARRYGGLGGTENFGFRVARTLAP
jgi:formylglycine-generating enzyme required for sulfatase activity